MPRMVGKDGGFFGCVRLCWCCPGGIGKEVKFCLVLVSTKNCPFSCIETRCSGTWLPQQRQLRLSAFFLLLDWFWTPREASWIPLGWIISSSCAKHSCWEPASLSGSSLHTSSPHKCSSCAQCTPNFLSQYMMCVCPGWSLTKIKSSAFKRSFHCDNIDNGRGGKSSSWAKFSCWESASLSGSSLHTSLSVCTLNTSPEVPTQCTLWRKVVIHYCCNAWCVFLLIAILWLWSL